MALTKISSNLVADDAIVTGKIADGGVATADLAANAVTTAKIAQNNVTAHHIADGSVTTTQLGADSVTNAKIADDAISEEHLDKTIISDLTEVTAVNGDFLMIGDTSDSNNLKKVPVSSLPGSSALPLAGGTMTGDLTTNGDIIIDNSSGDPFLKLKTSAQEYVIRIDQSDSEKFQIRDVTDSATRITLDGSGNVGIGDESPFAKLHVEDTGWSSGAPYGTVAYIQGGATNDANWGHLLLSQSGTTTDTGGRLAFGANGENPIAGIRAKYKGATYGDLGFSTRPSGGTNTERMVIDSSGNVGIGNTAPGDYYSNSNQLVVGSGAARQGITIASSTTTIGQLAFADGTSGDSRYEGSIVYNHNDNHMELNTNHATAIYIDSSGNVGIGGSGAPTKGKLQIDGGSSGSGDFDALAIKHVNTTTTGDGPVIRFEGEYSNSDWQLAEMKATNGGAGYGANFEIKTHAGNSVQGGATLGAFALKRIVSNQLEMTLHAGGASTYADNASTTISGVANTSCLIFIQSSRKAGGNSIAYDAALFFCHYGIDSGTNVIELADPGGTFVGDDNNGFVCVFKGNNSPNITIKNRLGYSTTLSIQIISTLGN